MILETLEFWTTPCAWSARMLGYMSATMGVRRRYLRCREAWRPHLERTRRLILDAAERCHLRRTAAVLGAGLLHDIPVRELSQRFERVLLVDIVHPWLSRLSCRRFRNVQQVTHDVTEVATALREAARHLDAELPVSQPRFLVEEADLDFTVSVNLLSQIPHVPTEFLHRRRERKEIDAYARHLVDAHLDYLRRLPGEVALITDVESRKLTLDERIVNTWDLLYGARLPPGEEWDWWLAPSPEIERGFHYIRHVVGIADWKRAGA